MAWRPPSSEGYRVCNERKSAKASSLFVCQESRTTYRSRNFGVSVDWDCANRSLEGPDNRSDKYNTAVPAITINTSNDATAHWGLRGRKIELIDAAWRCQSCATQGPNPGAARSLRLRVCRFVLVSNSFVIGIMIASNWVARA